MAEENQSENEIKLSDIFRALKEKIILIICVFLAGLFFGAGFGFYKYHNVDYYGTKTTYFVTSTGKIEGDEGSSLQIYQTYKEEILKQICTILSSEAFSSELMKKVPGYESVEVNSPDYERMLTAISKSVSFTYKEGENIIKASVSVLNNKPLAEKLVDGLREILPNYVKNMLGSQAFGTTNCNPLDNRPTRLLNPNQTTTEMIKFAAILSIVALVIVCVVVVIVDRSDNRLRDYESIPNKFDIPVLGVIPKFNTTNNKDKLVEKEEE